MIRHRVWGLGLGVWGSGSRGFRAKGLGFRVWGFVGFRILGGLQASGKHLSHYLSFFKEGYIGGYIGDYHMAY